MQVNVYKENKKEVIVFNCSGFRRCAVTNKFTICIDD